MSSVTTDTRVQEEEKRILEAAEESLSEIFAETGKRTVLYYLKMRDGLTLDDLLHRPDDVKTALGNILGEMGSGIVWQIMTERICTVMWPQGMEAGPRPKIALLDRLCEQPGLENGPRKVG